LFIGLCRGCSSLLQWIITCSSVSSSAPQHWHDGSSFCPSAGLPAFIMSAPSLALSGSRHGRASFDPVVCCAARCRCGSLHLPTPAWVVSFCCHRYPASRRPRTGTVGPMPNPLWADGVLMAPPFNGLVVDRRPAVVRWPPRESTRRHPSNKREIGAAAKRLGRDRLRKQTQAERSGSNKANQGGNQTASRSRSCP
jgi:hypothetical protein